MRILLLRLDAFGPFTQVVLDLSSGHEGLHLVYGPNEAGKTSALRAIRQLFYGIPPQTPDDFVHNYRNLRLGASLTRCDGERLEFVRLKRNKNPLLGADGVTPLAPSRLERFLGGVDQALFSSLFGIDHETLVKGGQEIVEGGGSLGSVLFSASSGISNLKGLQQQLQTDADELFKPGGKLQRIPQTIAELREANLRLTSLALSGDNWARHELALRTARERQATLEARWRERECEANRLKRIRAALPLLSERSQILGELEVYRDAVILPEDFADTRKQAQAARATAALEVQRARRLLDELRTRRDAIALPESLLAAESEVELLRDQQAEQRKAQSDRDRLMMFLQEKEHAAREILQSLGKERDLSVAESLRLRVDEPVRIAQLGRQSTELTTRRAAAQGAALRHAENLARFRKEVESLGVQPDLTGLRSALQSARTEGNLEDQLARLTSQLTPLERDLGVALRRLPGWKGSLDELERLAAPLPETVSRYESELQEQEALLGELERGEDREKEQIRELEAKLHGQSMRHEVPSEADLRDARERRESAWAEIRAAWLMEAGVASSRASYRIEAEAPESVAAAYEKSVTRADDLADRLRREAQSVAAKAEWTAQLEKHRVSLGQLSGQRDAAASRRDRTRGEWDALLCSLGLPPMVPSELRGWSILRDHVLSLHLKVRDLQGERNRLRLLIDGHRQRLAAAFPRPEGQAAAATPTLGSLIEIADALIARQEGTARKLDRLEGQISSERELLDAARLQLDATEAELRAWGGQWGAIMRRIGLGADATPEQANAFLAEITKLFQYIDEAKGFQSRIRGIDRDERRFESDARGLARRVAPDQEGQTPGQIADVLWDRLRAARDKLQQHRSLTERIEAEALALEQAEKAHAAAQLTLATLSRDARCASENDLPAAESRSARRNRLEAELRRCEGQIRQQSAGAAVESFAQEVARIDPDTMDRSIEDLDRELKQIQNEQREVNQTIGSEAAQLDQMDGSSKAAEANEAVGFALGQLLDDVPRFAVMRLASRVLQRGIERYRERNYGPVLARASAIFAALTQGSFSGLRIETGERDEPLIVGVRPDGQTLGVEGMSLGSCDQLYLAIRISYLEHWLAGREPIPFIVDDILLQFDDGRAMAALRVLGELSRKTQVIFFTHHAHLLELARACLPSDVLFPRMLPSGAPL